MNRRKFIQAGSAAALWPLAGHFNTLKAAEAVLQEDFRESSQRQLCMFTKPLQHYNYEDLATILHEVGFEGADIPLRPNGLILPKKAKQELPKLLKALQAKNITIPMAATHLIEANTANEELLKCMSDNGITYYRLGSYTYDPAYSIKANLEHFRVKLMKLAELNAKYGVHGDIQNHVGTKFGSAIWDAVTVLDQLNSPYIGLQYDVRHAMAEGFNTWSITLQRAIDYIYTTCVKNFVWQKQKGKTKPVSVPLSEGLVDYDLYLQLLKKRTHHGPVSFHYEYPLLTAEDKHKSHTAQMDLIIKSLRKDFDYYKQKL
ncbi:MAG: sugar phosphate isomerase/epimerase [Massilibacteroides sp.]|nr:sugar phosphate isomerase/epimerase [Massilibacteroides sp.]